MHRSHPPRIVQISRTDHASRYALKGSSPEILTLSAGMSAPVAHLFIFNINHLCRQLLVLDYRRFLFLISALSLSIMLTGR